MSITRKESTMNNEIAISNRTLPLLLSFILLLAACYSGSANAVVVQKNLTQTAAGTQLAYYYGYHHPRPFYGPRFNNRVYWGGWRPHRGYGQNCQRRCLVNQWNGRIIRCERRCW